MAEIWETIQDFNRGKGGSLGLKYTDKDYDLWLKHNKWFSDRLINRIQSTENNPSKDECSNLKKYLKNHNWVFRRCCNCPREWMEREDFKTMFRRWAILSARLTANIMLTDNEP